METNEKLNALGRQRLEIDRALAAMADQRAKVDAEIVALVGQKVEGAQTVTTGRYKITTTGRINRTVDAKTWASVLGKLPRRWHSVVKSDPVVVVSKLRDCQQNDPASFKQIARAMVSKPGKVGLKVEEVDL